MRQIRSKNILVLGDIMIDRYSQGVSTRLSPEAPVPVILVDEDRIFLGGAANAARQCQVLGAKTTLIGRLGLETEFDSEFKIFHDMYFIRSGRTTIKHRVVSNRQQVCRMDHEDLSDTVLSESNKKRIQECASEADAILVSDYRKGFVTRDLMDTLRPWRSKIVVDPKPEHKDLYSGLSLMTPNERELYLLAPETDTVRSMKKLYSEIRTPIACTLGPQGAAYYDGQRVQSIPAPVVSVKNVIGAGDVFSAIAVLGLANRIPYSEVLPLAVRAASSSTEHDYTWNLEIEDLENLLEA